MINGIDKLVEIIEDRYAMEQAMRIILWSLETRQLPPESSLPLFSDSLVNETFFAILERITGKEYK